MLVVGSGSRSGSLKLSQYTILPCNGPCNIFLHSTLALGSKAWQPGQKFFEEVMSLGIRQAFVGKSNPCSFKDAVARDLPQGTPEHGGVRDRDKDSCQFLPVDT